LNVASSSGEGYVAATGIPGPDEGVSPWQGVPRLSDQVAVVTGSSAGIGLATARRLLEDGVTVVLNGRDETRLGARAAELAESGSVIPVVGDACDPVVVQRLVDVAADAGGLHIGVACVGGGDVGRTLADLSEAALGTSYRRNVAGTVALLRAAAPVMANQGYGRLVAVSSLAGRRFGRVSGPDYSAHKAAVVGLTRHVAAELAPSGVTVNCVAPGVITTSRALTMAGALDARRAQAILDVTPMQRWGDPREVAAAICFLASPQASYITGHTLDVNGGAYMD